jgi:low temperature requirement protein LtrA
VTAPPPLRALADRGERQASWLELFFDLVFVVAVSALAAQLHHDHSLAGLAIFAGLFVPVWWAWMGFTWYATGFDTDDGAFRLALLTAMVGVAVLAAGVDGAADGDSELFVLAYAGLLAILVALYARAWRREQEARPLTARYAIGDAAGALLWLASLAFADGARPWVWAAAMAVLLVTPMVAVASLDRIAHDSRHIAERYGLFTLIVLGESVVATVDGIDTGSSSAGVAVALLGFVNAATIWWVYFGRWRAMPGSNHPAGFVWAQGHFLVFAGIAAAAVGVELAVEAAAHGEGLEPMARLVLSGGLAAYLTAMAMIRAATRRPDWVVGLRVGAAGLLVLLALPGLDALPFAALATALFVGEAVVEMSRAPAPREGG